MLLFIHWITFIVNFDVNFNVHYSSYFDHNISIFGEIGEKEVKRHARTIYVGPLGYANMHAREICQKHVYSTTQTDQNGHKRCLNWSGRSRCPNEPFVVELLK
jgi:hypothetical protein